MKAAVLGSPVAHSLSPALHLAAYRALGLDGWSYQAIECDEAGLPGRLAGCGPGWAGLSLTMPLKRAVLGTGVTTPSVTLQPFFSGVISPSASPLSGGTQLGSSL